MEKDKILLGVIHSPPPWGTKELLEGYYQSEVKTLLTLLYRFPDIPITMHFSGEFLEWLQGHHSEYLDVLSEMLKRKQAEILGGGYYSPLLPLVPHQDRLGQIEELTTSVRKLLGKRPRGCWIEKGVWDQSLAGNLAASGLEFTFLEDRSFLQAGRDPADIHQPALTENQGRTLILFPFSRQLSEKVEGGDFAALGRELESSGSTPRVVSLLFFRESWTSSGFFSDPAGLEAFLGTLQNLSSQLEGTLPSPYLKKNTDWGSRLYFPGGTWHQTSPQNPTADPWSRWFSGLGKETLPFRYGLGLFPDAGLLYCKMIFVHLLAYSIRGDKYKKKAVLDDLWRAQSRWGFFSWDEGGSADPFFKRNAFASLLTAEKRTRDLAAFQSFLSAQDYNLDGQPEYIFQGRHFNFFVSAKGGSLLEWDCLDKPWNYLDCLDLRGTKPRRESSFEDLFFAPGSDPMPGPDGGELRDRVYKLLDLNRDQKSLELSVKGDVVTDQGRTPVRLAKAFRFREHGLEVDWVLEPLAGWEGTFLFGTNLNLAFPFPTPDKLIFQEQDLGFTVLDKAQGLELRFRWDHQARMKTETASVPSLNGSENLYHHHRFLPLWSVRLAPGDVWKNTLRLDIVPL